MMPISKNYQSHFDIEDDEHVENNLKGTCQTSVKSLVYIPAFFESFSKQIEKLCVCASNVSGGQQVLNEDYSEYFGDMDLSRNSGLFATLHEDIYYRRMMADYPRTIEEDLGGGVEESKVQEHDDLIDAMPEDESTRIRKDFYKSSQSNRFASTALMRGEDTQTSSMKRKQAINAWLRPRPSHFDAYSLPSGQSAFQVYGRPQDCLVSSIAIEEQSEVLSVKKEKAQQPIGSYYFSNVDCYTRHQDADVIPPISTADTYTTVSLCHSMDSLMDSIDPLDDDEESDDEDVILVDRESVSNQTVSHCFRLQSPKSPPVTRTQGGHPGSPPNLSIRRSLLRMTPENYIHGDNSEDDRFYSSLAYSSKFLFLESDPANPPPMMPELH